MPSWPLTKLLPPHEQHSKAQPAQGGAEEPRDSGYSTNARSQRLPLGQGPTAPANRAPGPATPPSQPRLTAAVAKLCMVGDAAGVPSGPTQKTAAIDPGPPRPLTPPQRTLGWGEQGTLRACARTVRRRRVKTKWASLAHVQRATGRAVAGCAGKGVAAAVT